MFRNFGNGFWIALGFLMIIAAPLSYAINRMSVGFSYYFGVMLGAGFFYIGIINIRNKPVFRCRYDGWPDDDAVSVQAETPAGAARAFAERMYRTCQRFEQAKIYVDGRLFIVRAKAILYFEAEEMK